MSIRSEEQKVKVGGCEVNYLKVGNGQHTVLLLPGALGSIWTNFKPQVEGFDTDKFTVIAWDPPGCGKSRPPEREFTANFYEKDADVAHEFMQALQIPKYSVFGYSDGGTVGLILAAKYPAAVSKLVVWGCKAFILPHEVEAYNKTRNSKSWSPITRQMMIDVYGEENLFNLWSKWCDAMETLFYTNKGDICMQQLKHIRCPTFILYGKKDPIVDNVHTSHLHTNIKNSRIYMYPDGKHNIHLRYADDFNKRVQDFLLES